MSWIANAISSLGDIIKMYNLSGIDVDYENGVVDANGNPVPSFASVMGQVLGSVLGNNFVVHQPGGGTSVSTSLSYAPFGQTNAAYLSLYQQQSEAVQINYQAYADGLGSVSDYQNLYNKLAGEYTIQQVTPPLAVLGLGIASSTFSPLGLQLPDIITAWNDLKGQGLGSAFIWCLENSADSGYPIEKALIPNATPTTLPAPAPQPSPTPTSGSWSTNDLTAATGAPAAAGNPYGYMFTSNGVSGMHDVYRGADNHIHELYWENGGWSLNDLTAATKAPAAAGDPNGFMFTDNGVSGMHVVYRGTDNDIHELYWQNDNWSVNDLTAATSVPPGAVPGGPNPSGPQPAAAGDPNGFMFTSNGMSEMHVVYRNGVNTDIHELYWENGSWSLNDLTGATKAPPMAGNPHGFVFTSNGVSGMHVVYRGTDSHIHELYWQNGNWSLNDLTTATGAPAAAGDPHGFMFTSNGVSGMHDVYRGTDNHIHELYWQNGNWSLNDLTTATGAPAAAGDPNGFMFTSNGVSGMHVVYRGTDGHIHELYWQNGNWSLNDLTTATGAPAAAGDPEGYMFTDNGVSGMHVVYRGADNHIHELYWTGA